MITVVFMSISYRTRLTLRPSPVGRIDVEVGDQRRGLREFSSRSGGGVAFLRWRSGSSAPQHVVCEDESALSHPGYGGLERLDVASLSMSIRTTSNSPCVAWKISTAPPT